MTSKSTRITSEANATRGRRQFLKRLANYQLGFEAESKRWLEHDSVSSIEMRHEEDDNRVQWQHGDDVPYEPREQACREKHGAPVKEVCGACTFPARPYRLEKA